LYSIFLSIEKKEGREKTMNTMPCQTSATTIVMGAISLVLILGLAGSTVYFATNNRTTFKGCSEIESELTETQKLLNKANEEIKTLTNRLETTGDGFLKKKSGFFGLPIWIFVLVGTVFALFIFLAYFGPSSSRAIRRGAGAVGTALAQVAPSAIERRWNASTYRRDVPEATAPFVVEGF
tara:strand:- start:55 stop:594 length:540 start_codon:yes stop_codon:yes gene_type:complete